MRDGEDRRRMEKEREPCYLKPKAYTDRTIMRKEGSLHPGPAISSLQ